MFAFLLTLLILDALLLSVVVLLQAGQGGGLASLGGATTDTVLGGRQAVTLLTKATWWCGGLFLEGHYLRDGGGPYDAWVEALRAGLRAFPEDTLRRAVGPYGAELAALLPELAQRLGPQPPAPRLPPEDQRRRLYDGVTSLIEKGLDLRVRQFREPGSGAPAARTSGKQGIAALRHMVPQLHR